MVGLGPPTYAFALFQHLSPKDLSASDASTSATVVSQFEGLYSRAISGCGKGKFPNVLHEVGVCSMIKRISNLSSLWKGSTVTLRLGRSASKPKGRIAKVIAASILCGHN
jgi:hypothetical protein